MWFMNKIANPMVRLILGSRFHGLLSTALLLLTYRGRKSGKEYTLPVQYAQQGNKVYILPGMPQQKTWWRNLKEGRAVQVTLRGQQRPGEALVLDPQADSRERLAAFDQYLRRFPGVAKMHGVSTDANGQFATEDLARAARQVVMVRVVLL